MSSLRRTPPILAVFVLLSASCGVPAETDPTDNNSTGAAVDADGGHESDAAADSDGGPDDSRTPETDVDVPPQDMQPEEESLTEIHETVFLDGGCAVGYCHGNAMATPEAVLHGFVDVEAPAPVCGRTHYIVPGDPDQSILWIRVRPITAEDEECGQTKMPAGSEVGLPEETAQLVYDWIASGANL